MADSAEPRNLDSASQPARRYSGFISYSHGDGAFAARLHRQLESYRLPRRLQGKSGEELRPDRRLKPIFRDSDELSASYDLSAAVREAIGQSDHLIVICSPNSAKSDWVGREIEFYRTLHGDDRILAVIPDNTGEPAFHPALRGWLGGPAIEPLAADFRRTGGGRRLALLKLVSALAGVRLDELVQRDAQRQIRRAMVGAGAAVAGLAIVAGLSVAALNARNEAEIQRARAGGLNSFMLTDLRKGLRSAGRLDLSNAVNQAALDSYKGQDLSRLPPETLEERAKALQAAGEDNEKLGDLKTAQTQFEEARRTTAALLAARPNDPKRIYAQAQSEYWVGFINMRSGNGAAAKAAYEAYATLAARLVQIDPKNDDWQMETAYAATNLGSLALRQAGRPAEAEQHFHEALRVRQAVAEHKPGDPELMSANSNALAWLADSQRLNGDLLEALATRETQRKILAELLAKDPRNVDAKADMLAHDLAVARIEAAQHAYRRAITRLETGHQAALVLARTDPKNLDLAKQVRMFELFEVQTWLAMPAPGRPSSATVAALLGDCTPATAFANEEIGDFCSVLLARLREASGDHAGALAAFAPVQLHVAKRHEVLTAHWGLNLTDEARTIQVADSGGKSR